jgi:hypothetical protein
VSGSQPRESERKIMETALHVIKLTKHEGMEVQTSLFRNRMITRIFMDDDNHIPSKIIDRIVETDFCVTSVDSIHVSTERAWDDCHRVYSDTEYSGVEVETYAFTDARLVHDAIDEIVTNFLEKYKRVVTYVAK